MSRAGRWLCLIVVLSLHLARSSAPPCRTPLSTSCRSPLLPPCHSPFPPCHRSSLSRCCSLLICSPLSFCCSPFPPPPLPSCCHRLTHSPPCLCHLSRGLYTAPYFPVGIHWSPYGFVEFMWSPCGFSYSGPTQICVFFWTPARLQLESKSTTWNPGSPPHGPNMESRSTLCKVDK
jgi:hypothetical protein